jgi:hypothetical protein
MLSVCTVWVHTLCPDAVPSNIEPSLQKSPLGLCCNSPLTASQTPSCVQHCDRASQATSKMSPPKTHVNDSIQAINDNTWLIG